MPYYFNILKVYIIIYLVLYTLSKNITSEYNNEEEQNPDLDKTSPEINGAIFSYSTKGYDKTKSTIILFPNITLEVYIKIYTDSETLIEALENGYKLFFWFDFKIHNINSKEYNTDIIICIFDKKDVNCYDYVYDIRNDKYKRNNNGTLSNNYIIPLGFQNLSLNIYTKNDIGYQNYYSVNFNKKYLDKYQNYSLNNWIKNKQNNNVDKVIGFYGIAEPEDDLKEFSRNFPIYNGRKGTENNLINRIEAFIKYALIFYFTFIFIFR